MGVDIVGLPPSQEALHLPLFRNVSIAFDEMKIHEDIVFDKSGEIIGYVNTGDFNNKLREFEQQCKGEKTDKIATHMLTLMIRGIFFKMQFPYVQFPTKGLFIVVL